MPFKHVKSRNFGLERQGPWSPTPNTTSSNAKRARATQDTGPPTCRHAQRSRRGCMKTKVKPYMPNIDITKAKAMQMRIVPTRIQVVLMPLRPSSQYIRPKRIIWIMQGMIMSK